MNWSVLGAILKKDVRSLLAVVTLTALLFLGDALILRLELWPSWSILGPTVLLVTFAVLIIAVFQLDSPASLTEDWLCRPVRKRELLGAKVVLVLMTVYVPHAIGSTIADVRLGSPGSEILLDAVSLPGEVYLALMPLLMFIAIITRTFIHAFGVLFAIFVCVFLLPTPFVRPTGPLGPGIQDELLSSGMLWVSMTPARLTSLALVLLGFWLVYWRRKLMLARGLLVITVGVVVFAFVLPVVLLPWSSTFAVQAASGPPPPADAARISLHSTHACFPATMRSQQSSDVAFAAAASGLRRWSDDRLDNIGPNSVAYVTAIEAQGLPPEWSMKLNYAQADYSAGGVALESLRPAHYVTDKGGSGTLRHVWMLPESTLRQLENAPSQLRLTYSLTLLKPVDHSLPTDGKRRALPGIGWCSARIDAPGNRVEVDCFSAITHPTQITAQLNDIPGSRVYDDIDFAPGWAQQPYSRRLKLAVGSLGLAKHDTITVTAWQAMGYLDKSLTLPGILGGDPEICPLPTERKDFQQARWSDAVVHEAHSITVERGVQLEVLDFGGTGLPIMLLPGLGATAHSFDELAPLLARKHRVVAMTRRGSGYSSRPDFGYDTPQLAQDVLTVMDAMGLEKVVLAGHSIAGEELTWLGGHHPERFGALIYLDAAYDRSGDRRAPAAMRMRELGRFLPPEPPMPPGALLDFDAMTKVLLERGHLRLPEGELIAAWRVNVPGLAGTPNIDGRGSQAIAAAIRAPDYAAIKIPALAIYAINDQAAPLPPWYDADDEELIANLAKRAQLTSDVKRRNIDLFRRGVEKGQVLEIQNAGHYVFQSNQQEVLDAVERFVAGIG